MDTCMKRDNLILEAKSIAEAAKAAARDFTSDECARITEIEAEVKSLNEQIDNAVKARSIIEGFKNVEAAKAAIPVEERQAKSLGEHFIKKAASADLKSIMRGGVGATYTADEFAPAKAAEDVHTVPATPANLIMPDIDKNLVTPFRRRLFLSDWLLGGTIDSNALTYFVEKTSGALEGDFQTVAENAKAPALHFGGYDAVTETLRKIMGVIKVSSEMLEDASFLVSEINNRLLFQLALFEENQLLSGNGSGTNVKGLLNREGLQAKTAANAAALGDTIFSAMTQIEVATGLSPDALIINPADYEALRLEKDQNGQYLAGGPFTGAYGTSGLQLEPSPWGLTVIKTPAIPAKTVLVGSGAAATVYRKGGITVDTAFQNEDDFNHDRVAIRARERVALAVRQPAGFCKITVSA